MTHLGKLDNHEVMLNPTPVILVLDIFRNWWDCLSYLTCARAVLNSWGYRVFPEMLISKKKQGFTKTFIPAVYEERLWGHMMTSSLDKIFVKIKRITLNVFIIDNRLSI